MRNIRVQNILDTLGRVKEGATSALGEGREDHRLAMKRALEQEGKETDASRVDQMFGTNRTVTMMRELMGQADPNHVKARDNLGLGLSDDRATRVGQILGTLAGDVVQDRGREVWWLINAPQASANVLQEVALKKYAPDLYKADIVKDEMGNPVTPRNQAAARRLGLIDSDNKPTKGISVSEETVADGPTGKRKVKMYRKRNYEPGFVETLSIPAGIAMNTGIGLMNPFGGQEGYKAVLEDPDDPSKTSNVIGEVAAKYILGRTGNLLPWDEFKKVRPDVSKDEYMRYKAFKFDNDGDIDLSDGTAGIPTGVLKYNNDGIHGSEVQFLGRSLPLTTAILPTAAAIGGTAYGARKGPARGLGYGLASTAAGMLAGNIIENERRKRNAAENGIQL